MSGKKVRSSVNTRKSQFKFSKLKFKFGRVYKDDVHSNHEDNTYKNSF